jgi:hypothetical protein
MVPCTIGRVAFGLLLSKPNGHLAALTEAKSNDFESIFYK